MSTAWYVVKRIAHAIGWLVLLSIPTMVLAAATASLIAQSPNEVLLFVALLVVLAAGVVSWVYAIRRRWSLTWPMIGMVVVCWPFGLLWVTMIGLGKLIIHAVGRGGELAASDIPDAVLEARPRGMVEYASYE